MVKYLIVERIFFFLFSLQILYLAGLFNLSKFDLFDKTCHNYILIMIAQFLNFSSFVNYHANEVAWLKGRLKSLPSDKLNEQEILQRVRFNFFFQNICCAFFFSLIKLYIFFAIRNNLLTLGKKKITLQCLIWFTTVNNWNDRLLWCTTSKTFTFTNVLSFAI